MAVVRNISPDWHGSTRAERRVIQAILGREETPTAITYFARHCGRLGDYWYWYVLGTLWVSYSGFSDLNLWRRCFSSSRPNRESSLMKPDELEIFRLLPEKITAYRAHRHGEADWISYTLSPYVAGRFARERNVAKVVEYELDRKDILALFLRRRELEVLVLDPKRVRRVREVEV